VVVSHDRDFLNTVTTDIIHLHDQKLHYYRGNFAQFEEMYQQKRTEVNKAAEKFEKQLKAAKRTGNRVNQEKARRCRLPPLPGQVFFFFPKGRGQHFMLFGLRLCACCGCVRRRVASTAPAGCFDQAPAVGAML